ncbi:acyltransferase family protein [Sphingomonas asaccharolytica]|uniref:acyltransferase family protein n=1 Tax=Sphingomonas asaccharolytica TaxID=40681 RepID=UPI0008317180|nr:acyltransferase [Sphingomonas asaccharolytica]
MSSEKPDIRLIEPLTSIRFFAALAVVVFHSGASWMSANAHVPVPVKTLLLNGYLGVTFFFVLSGFILQFTYRGRILSGDEIKRFAVARFARLYPVYVLAVLAMFPFIVPGGWGDLPQFFLLHRWIPNGAQDWSNWNMPSWTLSVEFFFYLCFPLLSGALKATGTRWLIAIVATAIGFDLVTASSQVVDNRQVMFGWMHWAPIPILRLPEFIIGICAAEMSLRGIRLPIPSWLPAIALVIGLCLTGSPHVAAFATAMAALLILCVANENNSLFARVLSIRSLVVLGGASYSLYLMHQPVHFAVTTLLGTSKTVVVLQYPILISGSVAIFFWYEEPLREWIRRRIGMRPSAIEGVAGTHTTLTP